MKVLLSIKPQYVNRIINGTKHFEFRKAIWKRKDVTGVLVYASAPWCMVVGEFKVKGIYHSSPDVLWGVSWRHAGISRELFNDYFRDRKKGYAIEIGDFKRFWGPWMLEDFGVKHAPQNFVYLNEEDLPW